ncbi:PREDICTED: uncharacterized protein LOC108748323 isoform X3 [Trachymyrmex septentrionalis]|uniref:uncharacterized protein LOC108748323 isoform X3 n=1 Tax=Trachymyrmex septentrionalis TaxID=34720 RepID=UPI00084F599A|nr:PREDICTED: uncharacterized protein LOC108748323 isoform X3 [Trachymyrmex septentrionalis]
MIGSRFSGLSVCGIKPIHSISFTLEGVKKKWELIPLVLLNVCMMVVIPSMVYHRFFVSTIDIQPTAYQRFEIPSVPRFYDLRNPRSLKLIQFKPWKPAIHLDNRYRLMRHEPMLDADGNETDVIGKDDDC